MGFETLVPLDQARPLGALSGGQTDRRCTSNRSQPEHHVTRSMRLALFPAIHQRDIRGHGDVLRTGQAAANYQHTHPTSGCSFCNQNKIPIIRLNWSALLLTSLSSNDRKRPYSAENSRLERGRNTKFTRPPRFCTNIGLPAARTSAAVGLSTPAATFNSSVFVALNFSCDHPPMVSRPRTGV